MNKFKFDAFCEEFPFLREILQKYDKKGEYVPCDAVEIDSITIKRVDENLLNAIPKYYYWDGSMGLTRQNDKIHFVLADNSIIFDAVRQQGEEGSNYAHSQRRERAGETVLEAIARHGVLSELVYIVAENYYINDWEGLDFEKKFEVTIYKPMKTSSFTKEVQKAKVRALAEVKAEADF